MLKGLFILGDGNYEKIYSPEALKEIKKEVELVAPQMNKGQIKKNLKVLEPVEVIFSGWGGPRMDKEFLEAAPGLQAVFYGAGSIKGIVSDEFWERDITICSAWAANAVPVAEYTLSQILFSLKRGWYYAFNVKKEEKFLSKEGIPGAFDTTVGIISLGMIGRMVCEHLKSFDLNVIAYDPYVTEKKAAQLGVELVELEDIFTRSDVVSLHAPWLEETENMIKGRHFSLLKENASFINTARGAIVCEEEMISVLEKRPDLYAVLDVTYPEPPEKGSPLYSLPNVVLTPHIAGSVGRECWRMGQYMVEELKRFVNKKPLKWSVSKAEFEIMA